MIAVNKMEIHVKGVKKEKKKGELLEDIMDGDAGGTDPDIHDIFIEDNDIFENDYITDEGKEFIRSLIEKTDFSTSAKIYKPDENDVDFKTEESTEKKQDYEIKEEALMETVEVKNDLDDEIKNLIKKSRRVLKWRIKLNILKQYHHLTENPSIRGKG